jgi:hypothetical protein
MRLTDIHVTPTPLGTAVAAPAVVDFDFGPAPDRGCPR